jgi:signal transduction histidine kinase
VEHTVQVISQAAEALSALKDAETGQRGFIITGDSVYLVPYLQARESVSAHLITLRALTADNPSQQRRLDTLDRVANDKLAELAATIALRRSSGFDAAVAQVRTDRGRQSMEAARALISRIESEERGLLAQRSAGRATVARRVLGVIALGSFIAFLLSLIINRAIQADVAEQMRLRDRLAEEVEESRMLTEELEQTNQVLESAMGAAEDARAAATAANAAKSDFLATMSHELRTPINAIIGYTELLEREIFGPIAAEQRPHLARITSSAKHLLGLINEVLDLAKVESGTLELQEERGLVGDTVDSALALIQPQAMAKGLALSTVWNDSRDSFYFGDPQRVRQILTNLLANAVKFTDRGGRITVTCSLRDCPPVESGLPAAATWMAFHVDDTGIGIARAQLERIFEPFAQAESGYTRERSGTGLGLSISRRLARLMGGDITVNSTPSIGSRFTLWLPPASRPVTSAPEDARSQPLTSTADSSGGM